MPYSEIYKEFTTTEDILEEFSFLVFIKGNSHTNKHNKKIILYKIIIQK